MTLDEFKRRQEESQKQALANFPLKLIETTGEEALAKWQELRSAGQGYPVILGGEDGLNSFNNLLEPFGLNARPPRPVEDILKAAAAIDFPGDLARSNKAADDAARERFKSMLAANPDMPLPNTIVVTPDGKTRTKTREEVLADMQREPHDPPVGDWPNSIYPAPGLTVASDFRQQPFPKAYIGIAPTDDWTAIPAYLRWGGWNACPAPEYHVAAMRHWRDRYGAELVGMNGDTINMRAARKPATREEALVLAREQYVYCPDIVDQGVQTLSALAAGLMANDWWYFWWD